MYLIFDNKLKNVLAYRAAPEAAFAVQLQIGLEVKTLQKTQDTSYYYDKI